MPHLNSTPPWFAFIVHPRDLLDLDRCGATRFLRNYSTSDTEFIAKLDSVPPVVIGNVTFGFSNIRGEVVAVLRLPDAMSRPDACYAVLDGVRVALDRGARVIGLGALTSPATGGGFLLRKEIPPQATLTNGNAYTAAVIRQNVVEARQHLGVDATVAVVGATGSVGGALSRLLDQMGFRLILVGRKVERVQRLFQDLVGRHLFTDKLDTVRQAEVVILLTSEPAAHIMPDLPTPGSVIIDCAQPSNIPKTEYSVFSGRGVSVVEGGIVKIPGLRCDYNFGLGEPDATFACLAESYLFAREGIRVHSIGWAAVDLALSLEGVAQRYGIRPRPLPLSESVSPSVPAEFQQGIPGQQPHSCDHLGMSDRHRDQ